MGSSGGGILAELDDPRLLLALETNITEALAVAIANLGGEVYRGPEMTRFISGLPVSIFNGVALANLPEDDLDAGIAETLARFTSRALPMTWWVGPLTRPEGLEARLPAHGLTRDEDMPGMALAISALGPPVALPSVTISRVTTLDDLAMWSRTGSGWMGMPEAAAVAMFQSMLGADLTAATGRWAFHLAHLDGQPVATCMTFFEAGVAGIFMVGTHPEARGRGIGGEITRAALLDAGEAGYKVGVLQATTMGTPIYLRLGFETLTMYHTYEWRPVTPAAKAQEGA